ncbi:MAG: YeeE/YedE family protein, partial [Gammaproteobacteria bacterium]|nr:YeeE/YedE family protein [Gammaproteobacteria bacterium]
EYLLTVVAAYGGMQAVSKLEAIRPPLPSAVSVTGLTPIIAVSLLIGLMTVRWSVRRRMFRSFVILGVLMAIIGCAGAILGHFLQPWPWMNALTALPDVRKLTVVGLLFLIGGAMVSAIANGQFRVTAPTISDVGKRVVGGALMGMGTVLVPGGNDALILYGVPHGDMLAVFAYLTMLLAIAGTLLLTRSVSPPWSRPSV